MATPDPIEDAADSAARCIVARLPEAVREPKIAPTTVYVHPDQRWPAEVGFSPLMRGPEWRIGRRRGVWAIRTDRVTARTVLVRVQHDRRQALLAADGFGPNTFAGRLHDAIFCRPEAEMQDATSRAIQAARDFDAMAVELWERRDRQ